MVSVLVTVIMVQGISFIFGYLDPEGEVVVRNVLCWAGREVRGTIVIVVVFVCCAGS